MKIIVDSELANLAAISSRHQARFSLQIAINERQFSRLPRSRRSEYRFNFSSFLALFFAYFALLEACKEFVKPGSSNSIMHLFVFAVITGAMYCVIKWVMNSLQQMVVAFVGDNGTAQKLASVFVPKRVFETACVPSLWEINNEKTRMIAKYGSLNIKDRIFFHFKVALVIVDCIRIAAIDLILYKQVCRPQLDDIDKPDAR